MKLLTGKQRTEREHQDQLKAIEQMHNMIASMPDDFPEAILQSPRDGGYFIFNGGRQRIARHYGTDGWRKVVQYRDADTKTICVEWIKKTPEGVDIRIWGAETVPDTEIIFGQSVQPQEFGLEVTA
jgi:hypothetical protein